MALDWANVFVMLPAIIGNILLAWIVLLRNPRGLINRTFFLIGIVFGIWSAFLLFYEYPLILSHVFWIKATYLAASFLEVFVLMFSFIFPVPVFQRARVWAVVYSVFFLTLTAYLLYFTQSWVIDARVYPGKGLQTILGHGYLVWTAAIWVELGWAIINLFLNIRRSHGSVRTQLLYLMLGFALFGITATVADIIIPFVLHDTRLFPYSTAGSLFFTLAAAYVIVRHRFLDIKLALQTTFIFLIQILLFALLMDAGAVLYWSLSGNSVRPGVFFLIIGLSAMVVLVSGRVQQASQFLARKFLFQSVYDYQKTLRSLSLSLSSYLEMPRLVEIIINSLMQTMRINRVAILVRDFTDNHYKIQKTIGFNEENGISLVKDNFLTAYLEAHPQIIVLDEIKSLSEASRDVYEKQKLEELYDHMEHIEAALIVPVVNANQVISIIVLGNKISGDPYSVQDTNLLHTVASQASIAIENARLYREVASLNQNLQARINQATLELQKKNTALEHTYQSLKVLDKLKDDFVSVASHELRTPMTAIKSYLWMAINRPDIKLTERMSRYLSRAYVSTDRLINLVNDMLNVSRIEAGRIEIRPQSFDLTALAMDVAAEVAPKLNEKGIKLDILRVQVPPVFADPDKVHQVILNLVGNAAKFTPAGGVITVSFFSDGRSVEMAVKDSGVGIIKEDLSRLFQKFGRLDNSYTAAATAGGTGLGLYISRSLVEMMKGKIWADSEGLGKGATFTFSLPVSTREVLAEAEKYARKAVGEARVLEPAAI